MHALLRIWPTARSALRGCGIRLGAETGDTLIEVVVAAVIVVLIAIASLTGFDVANRSSADSKRHSQANQLAQQDQDRLRGLQVSQLTAVGNGSGSGTGLTGNESKTYTLDGTQFTVTSSSRFVADSSGGSSCTTSGTSNADYIKTTSTVTWPNMAPRTPVVQEGIITPPAGGSMLVQVTDQSNANLAGVSVAVTGTGAGTTPSSSATTDANGCAIFGGLIDGAYSLTTTKAGYVDRSGSATPTSAQTVVAGATDTATVQMGQATQINATFQTFYGGSAVARATNQDTWLAANTGLAAPGFRIFGTPNTFVPNVNSPNTIFPFTTPYNVYAGSCSADDPVSNGQSTDPTASVTPGGAAVPVSLTAPALVITPYSGSSPGPYMVGYPNRNSTTSTVPNRVVVTDTNCGNKRSYASGLLAPGGATGVLPDPGQPYGSYSVCAEFTGRTSNGMGGWNYATVRQTAAVANNPTPANLKNGTAVSLYFASSVAGACP